MERRHQKANALGIAALEVSFISAVIMVFAFVDPSRGAPVMVIVSVFTAAVWTAYGLYARHIGRDNGIIAFAIAVAWLMLCLAWAFMPHVI
jgi:hypothetical protein